ncbi:DNA replication and repair protein RecF [Alkalithermobacter thermoalcaliphilus JW-YL-7 = DSM 7308]|uniref:DNA replication and repair protein RecF n=1 Tax=Alkalithermobacter thermoalcaliphilus JW-YL-7 = DSM 7308 TaxID=1121328 RepID=A0A150FUB1_CLOPD|nr:DNA replication and repair protein recF [[Clostridium] paradoxum JW-YL-7 = DSM 7308]SHL08378.1 DNA replication and repair protein RecF [[Clostridium] paradoxum JW-YL-7 = DSM 7308]
MYIQDLKLINFRNYSNIYLEFNKNINLLVGKNGQGKTNILEAIYMLSIGKSFRTNKDSEIIMFDKESLYVSGSYFKNYNNNNIEIVVKKGSKKGIKINKSSINKIEHLLGKFNVVIFSPEDLKLVKEGPSERRKFIDREISQILPRYYHHLYKYNKILTQRNKHLKEGKIDASLIDVFDDTLSSEGAWIYFYRREFTQKIGKIASEIYRKLTDNVEVLDIKYVTQIDISGDYNHIKENLYSRIKASFKDDLMNKITKIGPHRDDIKIFINNFDSKFYASQGQQRTAAISLKLSEIYLIKEETNEYPVILLDDIFSELDEKRQKLLIDNLNNFQIFITTAEQSHKEIFKQKDLKIFNIDKGKVI